MAAARQTHAIIKKKEEMQRKTSMNDRNRLLFAHILRQLNLIPMWCHVHRLFLLFSSVCIHEPEVILSITHYVSFLRRHILCFVCLSSVSFYPHTIVQVALRDFILTMLIDVFQRHTQERITTTCMLWTCKLYCTANANI